MKIACFGYREWAKQIFRNLALIHKITDISRADVVLYYGWSEIIPKEIYENKLCLILHPSPLPKYRGGSPIQNQVLMGETYSAVTILEVGKKLDAGDIYSQTPFSLEGTLDEIFAKIVKIGTKDTIKVLNQIAKKTIRPIPQDDARATNVKRRKPEDSELIVEHFQNATARELYDFIRVLADPYPNAFIVCKDGKKLYFTGAHL